MDTETQILQAAERLFIEKGFVATSTTDIAREVGCNQALVHYYYRTKEKLFQKVFIAKFESIFSMLRQPLESDIGIFEKLQSVVDTYFDMFIDNRKVPFFIFNELILNGERRKVIKEMFFANATREELYRRYCQQIEDAIAKGQIRPIEPMDLYLNIVSLIVFSFITEPLFTDFLDYDDAQRKAFIARRRTEVVETLLRSLKP